MGNKGMFSTIIGGVESTFEDYRVVGTNTPQDEDESRTFTRY